MKRSRKIQALEHIQVATIGGQPTKPTAVGLKEDELYVLEKEGLIDVYFGDDDPTWEQHFIKGLTDKGQGLLCQSEKLPPSRLTEVLKVIGSGIWDVTKEAIKILIGIIIGYYYAKHFK